MDDAITLTLTRDDVAVDETIENTEEGTVEVHGRGRHAAAICPSCLVPSMRTNGGRTRRVGDRVHTLVVWLVLYVRRFVCENPACGQRTFCESFDGISRSKFTGRLWRWVGDLGRGQTEQGLARERGLSSYLCRKSARWAKTAAVSFRRPRLPEVLAIDECSHAKHRRYGTVFSDPVTGVVCDVGPGRSAAVIWAFASRYSFTERLRVRLVTIDCNGAWKRVLRLAFPKALVVADHFHLQRRVLRGFAQVRNQAADRRPEWNKVFTDARYALAKRPEKLTDDQELMVHDATHLDGRLGDAYDLVQWFRAVMDSDLEVDEMIGLLDAWIAEAKTFGDPFAGTARSFAYWRDEIIAYARSGNATNGFAEGITNTIKVRKRIAYGYPSWHSFRATIVWILGEAIDPTTGELIPIRSIPPGQGTDLIQPPFA